MLLQLDVQMYQHRYMPIWDEHMFAWHKWYITDIHDEGLCRLGGLSTCIWGGMPHLSEMSVLLARRCHGPIFIVYNALFARQVSTLK